MRKVVLHGRVLELYDSVDEMPIVNFQAYNRYILLDSGIGSDLDSVDKHITKIGKLLAQDDRAAAMQELQNMRQNLFMVVTKTAPNHMAFAALVKSVDGKPCSDLSEAGLKALSEKINRAKYGKFISILTAVKKKLDAELEEYFPAYFENATVKGQYDGIKRRTQFVLEQIITGEDKSKSIAEVETMLFAKYKPGKFIGVDSAELKYIKQFESACLIISEELGTDPKQMTVFQFYNALEIIDKRFKERERIMKRTKKHK